MGVNTIGLVFPKKTEVGEKPTNVDKAEQKAETNKKPTAKGK